MHERRAVAILSHLISICSNSCTSPWHPLQIDGKASCRIWASERTCIWHPDPLIPNSLSSGMAATALS